MKRILIFFWLLISSLKNHVFTYGILLLSFTITISSVTVFFSVQNESSRRQIEENYNMRTVTVVPNGAVTGDALLSLLNDSKLNLQNIQIYCKTKTNEEFRYSIFSEMLPTQYNAFFGKRISEENVKNSDKVVVAPADYLKERSKKQGDNLLLNGVDYTVIGENNLSDNNNFEIPYTTFLNYNQPERVSLIFPHTMSSSEYQEIETYLRSNQDFAVQSVILPHSDEEMARRVSSDLLFCAIVFGLAFINFSYLYRYLLEKRKRSFGIYKITGSSNTTSFVALMFETVILYSVSFVLGVLLSVLINTSVLPGLLGTKAIPIIMGDIWQLYITILAMLAIGMTFLILRFLRNSPMMQLRESEE